MRAFSLAGIKAVSIACGGGGDIPRPGNRLFQPTAQPLVAVGWSLKAEAEAKAALGRAGGGRRGRCKYVHVSSIAASMRLTPLRPPPARPLTVSVCCPATEKKKENQNQTPVASLASTHGVDLLSTRVDTCQPSQFTSRHRETVRGGAVWVGRTVGAMDGAIEP
ncbi:hypothetical protein R1G71_12905, partial [Stenotrophomonas sp. C1657]|nr:hypothetical protein [Stenotrophomonas sp. C1657]